jgi:heterodisulfide reductase subunit C/nitrate reductase gamma subunit
VPQTTTKGFSIAVMPPTTLATLALGICLAGLLWRISRWFRSEIGPESRDLTAARRIAAAGRGLRDVLLSRRLIRLAGAFLWDVLLLAPLLRRHPLRWAAHMVLCYGFLLLVVFHALDDWTAPLFFGDYEPTLNPFRWWRNLLAALVLAGVLAAVLRQRFHPDAKRFRTPADRVLLLLVSLIIVSGILLESAQIVSPSVFHAMVEDYMGTDDPGEVAALQHYWAAEFGAWPPPSGRGARADELTAGQSAHEAYCAACHDRPQGAFLSYPTSRALMPLTGVMDRHRIDRWLWTIHFWAACLALACLPFSKLFHFLATPLSLLIRDAGPAADAPALRPMRRALALDACTHCGVCSQHCSVAPMYNVLRNPNILPAEKLQGLKHRPSSGTAGAAWLAEGSFVCTLCGRCTQWCPSGIDLQDLWQASRHDFVQSGLGPFNGQAVGPLPETAHDCGRIPATAIPLSLKLTERPETFWACVQCTTCTSVCPVVAASDDPRRDLDLTPQQIMNLMRLQRKEQALVSRMLWDCVTCYKCQEHCPQNVKVADILYELRNEAWQRWTLTGGADRETPANGRIP